MPWKQEPNRDVSSTAVTAAKRLRRESTPAEKVLWGHLRGDFAGTGSHFRRQVPIGPYVVDFCCFGRRVIVELDGPIHETLQAKKRDALRDHYLRSQGFKLLRVRNEDVMLRRDEVLGRVRAALVATTPTPYPSPQGGGDSPEPSPR